jgi:hypothetical protein
MQYSSLHSHDLFKIWAKIHDVSHRHWVILLYKLHKSMHIFMLSVRNHVDALPRDLFDADFALVPGWQVHPASALLAPPMNPGISGHAPAHALDGILVLAKYPGAEAVHLPFGLRFDTSPGGWADPPIAQTAAQGAPYGEPTAGSAETSVDYVTVPRWSIETSQCGVGGKAPSLRLGPAGIAQQDIPPDSLHRLLTLKDPEAPQ